MRTFTFENLRPIDRLLVESFALHVQCPWHVEGPEDILTGRSDLWEPVDDDSPFEHYETSPNLQDARMESWSAGNNLPLVVTRVDADEFGGAAMSFDQGFVLRKFPAGSRGEDWRLFQSKQDASHFVISGGSVEPDGEPEE